MQTLYDKSNFTGGGEVVDTTIGLIKVARH